jgi:hypothetical protein
MFVASIPKIKFGLSLNTIRLPFVPAKCLNSDLDVEFQVLTSLVLRASCEQAVRVHSDDSHTERNAVTQGARK